MQTILHTIDTTGPGGAETVFIDIASGLSAERYRSLVCIRGEGWVNDELRRRGFDPVIIPAKGSFNTRYLRSLVALIRRERVDLVQSHLLGANVYCSLAGLLSSTPVVSTFHGQVDIGLNERFRRLKSAAINRGSDRIVAVSNRLREDILSQTALRPDKLQVIFNGIDTQAFQSGSAAPLRERFGWQADTIIVGCLGNVRPAKGYDILLEAVVRAKQSGSNLRFVIAGQGRADLDEQLGRVMDEHGLHEHVKFLGFIDDAAGFLAGLDVFLLPSTSEGFSIATIQAMSAGLPVVVTRSGGPEEIVTHRETGIMIEPGDADAIWQALSTLQQEPDLCRSLAEQGKRYAETTFGIEAMIGAYSALYEELIGSD